MINRKQLKKARARALRKSEVAITEALPLVHLVLDDGRIPSTSPLERAIGEHSLCGGNLEGTNLGLAVRATFKRVQAAAEAAVAEKGKRKK